MTQGELSGTLRTLKHHSWDFFYRRCLTGFPWFWPARPLGIPAMVAARRIIRRHFGRDHRPFYRALARVFVAMVWPPAVLIHLWQMRFSIGSDWVPIKRAPGAVWAALRHNVPPAEYYAYALWKPDRKSNIDNYLYAKEGWRLFKMLNRPIQPNPIDDKLAFGELCRAFAIPSPEILAIFGPAGRLLEFETGQPPQRDLFVKPRIGLGGPGTERFRWGGIVFESSRGCRLRPEDLHNYLGTRALNENRTLLVQPALSNHPALRTGSDAGLAVARLTTGLAADGKVFVIFGLMFLTKTDQIPSRYEMVALIDVASGRLSLSGGLFGVTQSNQQLDGDFVDVLPGWEMAVQHAKVAHQACSRFAFVGWDVAFTPQGPVVLEGNANWSAYEYQRLSGAPLGRTKFADILATRLRDLEAVSSPAL